MSSYGTVVIREKDGNTHIHNANLALSWIVENIRFIEKSPELIKGFLDVGYDMLKHVAPTNSGLIVLDQMKDKVITYTPGTNHAFGLLSTISVSYYLSLNNGNVKARLIDNAPTDLKPELIGFYIDNFDLEPVRLREFYEQGKVKHLIEWNPKEQDYSGKIRSIEGMSLEQIGLLALQNKRPSKAFALDMAPYEMIDFLTPMGAVDWETATQQTKELLTELGFNVNHKEWDKWKKEWDEE